MVRYFIELAYNGSRYHGWQIQPGASSVQEEINRALSTLLRQDIYVVGAGRTDTGVHASFFVAHFDIECELPEPQQVVYKLNGLLDKDIAIYKIYRVPMDKHARFSAISRTYKYYITTRKDPFNYDLVYRMSGQLDFEAMNEACKVLFDYIDFTSFSKLHTDVKTNNCRIYKAGWEQEGDVWVFTVQADRFLRNMVRAIVGTLLEVGRGKLTVEGFRKVIEAKDRCKAGTSVPGHALFLVDVTYPENIFNI